MSPRYEDGEICFVDPMRRVKKGDYVIAQIRMDEHGPLLAFVKKFIRHNSIELVLEQFNPPKELRFPASAVATVHFIALAGNA
jgi:phage repressor protein C with HTH and peptisase S24 domain